MQQLAYTGSTIYIKCFSESLVKWTNGRGKIISTSKDIENVLVLKIVKEKHSGYYICHGRHKNNQTFKHSSLLLVGGMKE